MTSGENRKDPDHRGCLKIQRYSFRKHQDGGLNQMSALPGRTFK